MSSWIFTLIFLLSAVISIVLTAIAIRKIMKGKSLCIYFVLIVIFSWLLTFLNLAISMNMVK